MTPDRLGPFAATAALLALAACGSKPVEAPGTYQLDVPDFVDHASQALVDAGRIPKEAKRLARQMLGQVKFQLEIRPDHEWTARMGTPQETHDYKGTWQLSGNHVLLSQTHQDEEEVSDSMSGTLSGDVLTLHHDEQGMAMPYTLRRQAGTPARPN